MRQTCAVNVRKALWWGDGAKPHILEMLRLLYLEMFVFSLTAPLFFTLSCLSKTCYNTPIKQIKISIFKSFIFIKIF